MLRRDYNNFVRSTSPTKIIASNIISGEEARKLYLEEVVHGIQEPRFGNPNVSTQNVSHTKLKRKPDNLEVSNLKLFTSVQDNDVDSLQLILDACPDKINTVDEYGWSLLMIACQAKSYQAVKELLKRGIDTTVQDKAGNSAQSLIIRNKDSYLADILLSHISNCGQPKKRNVIVKEIKHKKKQKEKYVCEICDGKTFDSKEEHLSSTIHNINASKDREVHLCESVTTAHVSVPTFAEFQIGKEQSSQSSESIMLTSEQPKINEFRITKPSHSSTSMQISGRKIPTNYVIPQSNKGYQIMLKTGWDKESGLGPDGSGKKYPIKAVQKNDKKGLGHEQKRLKISNEESTKQQINKHLESAYERDRRLEINFRRQFY